MAAKNGHGMQRGGRGAEVSVGAHGGKLTEMPTPLMPRSPSPRMRDPSVTTQISGMGYGQLRSMVRIDFRCLIEMYSASGLVYSVEYCRQTSPMVGV